MPRPERRGCRFTSGEDERCSPLFAAARCSERQVRARMCSPLGGRSASFERWYALLQRSRHFDGRFQAELVHFLTQRDRRLRRQQRAPSRRSCRQKWATLRSAARLAGEAERERTFPLAHSSSACCGERVTAPVGALPSRADAAPCITPPAQQLRARLQRRGRHCARGGRHSRRLAVRPTGGRWRQAARGCGHCRVSRRARLRQPR